jgi:hypothetical protein
VLLKWRHGILFNISFLAVKALKVFHTVDIITVLLFEKNSQKRNFGLSLTTMNSLFLGPRIFFFLALVWAASMQHYSCTVGLNINESRFNLKSKRNA